MEGCFQSLGIALFRHTRLTFEGHVPQDGESWKANGGDLAAVAIVTGQAAQDELRYLKSASMQLWLLGYELTGEPHLTAGSPAPCSSCLACGTCEQTHCQSGFVMCQTASYFVVM